MTKPTVYVETSVISYLAAKPSFEPVTHAYQLVTQSWWREHRRKFDLFISRTVWDEASDGDPDAVKRRLKFLKGIPWLQTRRAGMNLANELLQRNVIPEHAAADALHLALAAEHGMEFLTTWNFAHIANAAHEDRIRAICSKFGFELPVLCSPAQLIEFYNEN